MVAKRSRRSIRTAGNMNRTKGRLVEAIVASMHEAPGIFIQQNVRLPVIGSESGRTSEIDVLVNGAIAGYPIRLAIECKNEKAIVDAPKINSFFGKLNDVGIPPQHGIFVSIKGFTKGALERARKDGIRTLVLTGLTADRLSEVLHEAMQAVVHLWPVLDSFEVQNEFSNIEAPEQLTMLYDRDGNEAASIADLTWRQWYEGNVPATLGKHTIKLTLPSDWHQVIDGKRSVPVGVAVTLQVFGLVVVFRGKATHHGLVEANSGSVQKLNLIAKFDASPDAPTVKSFSTEEQLTQYVGASGAAIRVVQRMRLPRMDWGGLFWPPSKRLYARIQELIAAGNDPASIDIARLDPPSVAGMWEPVTFTRTLRRVLEARMGNGGAEHITGAGGEPSS